MAPERPLGVTIIGILWLIGGILALLGGLGIAALGGVFLGAFGAVIGFFFVIVGIIDIILGIGCFKAWPWVWTVGVIISILSIIAGIASLITSGAGALLGIVISGIILYYLFQPHVKAYFGKA